MSEWICNGRPEDKISSDQIRTRLILNGIMEYLEVKRLQWFGHVERMEESALSSKLKRLKLVTNSLDDKLGKQQER